MPRPTRIQYENAYYHVMNRGKARQTIFHGEIYYQAFLQTLDEAHKRFDACIHAYCLMGNHYHLLIETPRANLDRIMRHINGIYTQRYNRLRRTDGPLFRGRYKAIIVDTDDYLLPLSRYIHRNPIVAAVFGVNASDVLTRQRGRQRANLPRKVAIYCCQQLGDMPLKTLVDMFVYSRVSSLSPAIDYVKSGLSDGSLKGVFEQVCNRLKNIKYD